MSRLIRRNSIIAAGKNRRRSQERQTGRSKEFAWRRCITAELDYLQAPDGWDHESANPFTPDGSYGPYWSCFRVVESKWEPYGRTDRGLYFISPRPDSPILARRLADFLRYEASYGRKVIVSCPEDFDMKALVADATLISPPDSQPRPDDPKWLVHSTSLENWKSIQAVGELRSLAMLSRNGIETGGIGLRGFGEPEDYAHHIMLGLPENIGPEHVVASLGRGEVITEENTPYQPGARLYFDGHKIIRDGLMVRDGLHMHKVRDRLPLAPYLVAAITVADVDREGKVAEWTPRSFLDGAGECFAEIISSQPALSDY
jgi:hypothetical protein